MRFSTLYQLVTLSVALIGFVAAHPGDDHKLDAHEFARRRLEADKRHVAARNCAPSIARFEMQRKAKRSALRKRGFHPPPPPPPHHSSSSIASSTSSASVPHHTAINNYTCIVAPDVTEGPYYINNELVRTNLSENQPGVELILDIGVIDIETCLPLSNAFIELWMANATGVYGGYPATLGGPGGPPPGSNISTSFTATAPASSTFTISGNNSASATTTRGPGGPPGGGPPGGSMPLARNETFLRGGWHTNKEGIVEITTIYTGYYQGRTPHIHTMVHIDWEKSPNGTLISHAGSVAHIGQFFFDESWNDKVFELEPYTSNTNDRTLNSEDGILTEETANGNNAFIDLELLGEEIADGLLGYVTMGVNASASLRISNTNYYNSSTTTV